MSDENREIPIFGAQLMHPGDKSVVMIMVAKEDAELAAKRITAVVTKPATPPPAQGDVRERVARFLSTEWRPVPWKYFLEAADRLLALLAPADTGAAPQGQDVRENEKAIRRVINDSIQRGWVMGKNGEGLDNNIDAAVEHFFNRPSIRRLLALPSAAPGARAMVWTKEKPTREGWYWYRNALSGVAAGSIEWIRINENDVAEWYDDYNDEWLIPSDDIEWAGPLPEPEQPAPQPNTDQEKSQ